MGQQENADAPNNNTPPADEMSGQTASVFRPHRMGGNAFTVVKKSAEGPPRHSKTNYRDLRPYQHPPGNLSPMMSDAPATETGPRPGKGLLPRNPSGRTTILASPPATDERV